MHGLMMHKQLLISSLIEHADRHHGDTQIVSRRVEGDIHRYTFRDCHRRARQLASALTGLGVQPADRIGTLAWNGYRHLELYYGIGGMGAIVHTINPRLHEDQVAYIANHAEDQYLFFDLTFLPLIKLIAGRCSGVKAFIAMTDRAHMPTDAGIDNLLCYEDLLQQGASDYAWPELDEDAACTLCYTSGTTGNPKGVLYSHRSSLLHTYAAALPDALNCSARDVILPVVPAAGASGTNRRVFFQHATHHHWRRSLSLGHAAQVSADLRRGGVARVGHDRVEPDRHHWHPQGQAP